MTSTPPSRPRSWTVRFCYASAVLIVGVAIYAFATGLIFPGFIILFMTVPMLALAGEQMAHEERDRRRNRR
ncbi:hypothetical protein [Streptosporangium sandarakinum]